MNDGTSVARCRFLARSVAKSASREYARRVQYASSDKKPTGVKFKDEKVPADFREPIEKFRARRRASESRLLARS
jgi:hypothetical protein